MYIHTHFNGAMLKVNDDIYSKREGTNILIKQGERHFSSYGKNKLQFRQHSANQTCTPCNGIKTNLYMPITRYYTKENVDMY